LICDKIKGRGLLFFAKKMEEKEEEIREGEGRPLARS
jgi:hypothetical protein